MSITMAIMVAIGLSMDAFSLAMIYGTLNLEKKTIQSLSITVGIFHFIMPIIGFLLGKVILNFLPIKPDVLVGIIFIFIAVQMIISIFKKEDVQSLTGLLSLLLFGFTVSIDSFSVGVGLSGVVKNIYLPAIIFSLVSGCFTFLGLKLGTKLATKFGSIATLIGSIILFWLGLHYFHWC